ncbi:hypothetical protein [Caproicibacter sp.]|uniref:hypothetical protein n=1 Tax=Caproicibacter sp. TaxID=2814884 RepID=UPI0039898D75
MFNLSQKAGGGSEGAATTPAKLCFRFTPRYTAGRRCSGTLPGRWCGGSLPGVSSLSPAKPSAG